MMAHMNVSSHVWLLTGNNIKVINELIHIKNEDESILLLLCERQIQFSELGFYLFFICLIFRYIFTKQITIIKNHLTLLIFFQKSQISLETNQIFQGPTQMTTCGTQYMENISPSLDIGTRTCLDCCLQDRGNKWGGGNVMTI